ncbi:MAG: radical SAM protein [Planctomycetota bacterium]|nr:radical SAM protein [Planctomycetota bacterium]
MIQTCFHVTVLSNFARGFDKYSDTYSKTLIPESTFPDRFYVLNRKQLAIGFRKATCLLEKLNLPGNELLVVETQLLDEQLHDNTRNGLGQFVMSSSLQVTRLFRALPVANGGGFHLEETTPEDAMAKSLALLSHELQPFSRLLPRTLSVLPIARGCQASCPFCFSEASVSAVQEQAQLQLHQVRHYAEAAKARGAERFVITGGGEPGLVRHSRLLELIDIGRQELGKSVLITNSHHLGSLSEHDRLTRLSEYADAGLNVLAISRHHFDDRRNAALMNLRIDSAAVAQTWARHREALGRMQLRFICVLQSGGIASSEMIADYLTWASSLNVEEVCFKELYVSTSTESVFHTFPANIWSRRHRVPLSLVIDFASTHNFTESIRLPWGSPVFTGAWNGRAMRIAAYTEPSLFWERANGIARSWNVMADGNCFVSLEDRASEISLEQVVA